MPSKDFTRHCDAIATGKHKNAKRVNVAASFLRSMLVSFKINSFTGKYAIIEINMKRIVPNIVVVSIYLFLISFDDVEDTILARLLPPLMSNNLTKAIMPTVIDHKPIASIPEIIITSFAERK
jgi:hypothetical protein